jgi:hypothetical protein
MNLAVDLKRHGLGFLHVDFVMLRQIGGRLEIQAWFSNLDFPKRNPPTNEATPQAEQVIFQLD